MKKFNPLLCFLLLAIIVTEISVISYVVYTGKLKKTYYDEAAVQQMIENIRNMKPAKNPVATTTVSVGNVATSTATTTQPLIEKIDEHLTINNELRDVNFCGKTYQAKQVLLDGVDVAQRIAEIATKDLVLENIKNGPPIIKKGQMAKDICESMGYSTRTDIIPIEIYPTDKNSEKYLKGAEKVYNIQIGISIYSFHIPSNEIYSVDEYSGTGVGPIGMLK